MAYIQPDSTIVLIRGCPLDNTYRHTIFFADEHSQYDYFYAKRKSNNHVFSNQYYQRVNREKIRIQVNAESILDCNYLMFENHAYSNKWFYAFINQIDYINNNVAEITYQIDVMQTWVHDYELNEVYIERETTATDVAGENILPEPIETGELVCNDYARLLDTDSIIYIIAVADYDNQSTPSKGQIYDRIYSGACLWAFSGSSVTAINDFLSDYIDMPDAILSIYVCPKAFLVADSSLDTQLATGYQITNGHSALKYIRSTPAIVTTGSGRTTLNGYTPRNKKLYTYPYNFLAVNNSSGQALITRYEFFQGNSQGNSAPEFEIAPTITQPVQAVCRPMHYKGVGANNTNDFESISLTNFPLCSWSFDAFQAWVAQEGPPMAYQAMGSLMSMLVGNGFGYGGVAKEGTSMQRQLGSADLFQTAADFMSMHYKASIASDISRGSVYNGNSNVSNMHQDFNYARMSVTAQMAKTIDAFFDIFGYAVHEVRKPILNVRPHWYYVKTKGCTLSHPRMPASDCAIIESIFDSGVTFWKDGDEIGDYSLDNTV